MAKRTHSLLGMRSRWTFLVFDTRKQAKWSLWSSYRAKITHAALTKPFHLFESKYSELCIPSLNLQFSVRLRSFHFGEVQVSDWRTNASHEVCQHQRDWFSAVRAAVTKHVSFAEECNEMPALTWEVMSCCTAAWLKACSFSPQLPAQMTPNFARKSFDGPGQIQRSASAQSVLYPWTLIWRYR